ncbi:MAG: hypothetical protein Q8P24_17280 [Desulfobacterales bacterium]|nr:hypothetical protein [Desulfobacterales bacterium]
MAKEWQTFVRKYEDLQEGKTRLFIKDLTPGPAKYDTRQVRATVSRSKDALPGAEILWVRGESGLKSPEPWFIKIHEELDAWVPGKPWDNVFEALERSEKG